MMHAINKYSIINTYSFSPKTNKMESNKINNPLMKFFLFFNAFLLLAGVVAGGLLTRLYFIHGGRRIWLSAWLQTAGFPIILIPLSISYANRRRIHGSRSAKLFLMKPFLFCCASFIGVSFGGVTYMYGYGTAKLPVSTGALIYSCLLAFTAGFAFILVKQKFTPYTVNSVVLLTVGAVVLALNASTDRPKGETKKDYVMGFILMAFAAALEGFLMPLMELAYEKANQSVSYTLTMEFDFVMCLFATGFTTVGMLVNNDFKAIGREAREYDLGHVTYYIVLAFDAIAFQCSFLGLNGVIFCATSLLSGILVAVSMPIQEVLAVILFREKFQAQKGVSLALSIWGFVSYFYGEIRNNKKRNQSLQVETSQVGNFQKNLEEEHTLAIN